MASGSPACGGGTGGQGPGSRRSRGPRPETIPRSVAWQASARPFRPICPGPGRGPGRSAMPVPAAAAGPAWAPSSGATPNGSRRCVARRRGRQPRSRCSCLTGLADPCSLDVHGSRLAGLRSPHILTSGKCRSREEGHLPAAGRPRAPALLVRASRAIREHLIAEIQARAAVFVAAAGSAIRTGNRCRTLTSFSQAGPSTVLQRLRSRNGAVAKLTTSAMPSLLAERLMRAVQRTGHCEAT
jgi:hypothetical protein